MDDDIPNPYTPKHSIESQRGFPIPKIKWNRPIPMCSNCGARRVYLPEIETMDWCEHCLWEYVREDSCPNRATNYGEQERAGATPSEEGTKVLGRWDETCSPAT